MEKVVVPRLTPVGLDQKDDLLEGEEGNGDGEDDALEVDRGCAERIPVVHEEICVLEVAQQREVRGDSEPRVEPPPGGRGRLNDVPTEPVVEADGDDDDCDVGEMPIRVEEKRRHQEPAEAPAACCPTCRQGNRPPA